MGIMTTTRWFLFSSPESLSLPLKSNKNRRRQVAACQWIPFRLAESSPPLLFSVSPLIMSCGRLTEMIMILPEMRKGAKDSCLSVYGFSRSPIISSLLMSGIHASIQSVLESVISLVFTPFLSFHFGRWTPFLLGAWKIMEQVWHEPDSNHFSVMWVVFYKDSSFTPIHSF